MIYPCHVYVVYVCCFFFVFWSSLHSSKIEIFEPARHLSVIFHHQSDPYRRVAPTSEGLLGCSNFVLD